MDQASGSDRPALRRRLSAERLALPDRAARDERIAAGLAAWLAGRAETTIGAYWPFRGEFDPLGVLARWAAEDTGDGPGRRLALPVVDPATKRMRFHEWYPGCPTVPDAYGIPEPAGTPPLEPGLLVVACLGFGPGNVRLGYGGGYYDRHLASLDPRPATVGIAYAHGYVADLVPGPHDVPLDAILTEEGIADPGARGPQ